MTPVTADAEQSGATSARLEGPESPQVDALRLALESHAQVSVTDARGSIIHVNDHFCTLSGYPREELLGHAHDLLQSGHHPPDYFRTLWETIRDGRVWKGELRNRRKDGSLYWVEATIVPVRDAQGCPLQYVEVSTDITPLKHTEAMLRRQNTLQRIVGDAAGGMLAAAARDMDAAINRALAEVGESMGVDRACLFQCEAGAGVMANTHEWCGPGTRALREVYEELPMADYPWWCQRMDERGPLVLSDLNELPGQAANERRLLEGRGVRAAVVFPLRVQGRPSGFIALESLDSPHPWAVEDIELVENLTDFFSNALARWHAEQALELNKERLRRGQIFANIGTWEWHIPTGELYWSERIPALFGHAEGTLETSIENFMQAVHRDDRAMLTATIEDALERDAPYEVEHRVVWPDGTVRWLLERGAVVRDEAGMPLQMLGVVQDIDDRKRAELALAERERQLREAQALARLGSWQADLATGTLTWSDEVYRIFGHEPGTIRPDVEAFYAHVHPEDLQAVRESETRAATNGHHDLIHRVVRPDGSVRHVHEMAQAESDDQGRLRRLTGTVQDITERVETERALIAARDEAERANRAKSEFLSAMSHELRTPMNAILGFGQLMDYDDSLPAEHRDGVHEILKAGNHLLELINEVLDLSRVEAGRVNLSLEPVEVDSVAEECLSLVTILAERRGVRLSRAGQPGQSVRADRTRLKQALLNLVSNAIKYNHEGGEVVVETLPLSEDRLQIRVRDTGPGIPPERIGELFQPFNRLGAEGSDIEGSGIGLILTRRITEMMGGRVDVESAPGVGSTFWIELPRDEPTRVSDPGGGPPTPEAGPDPAAEPAGHTVLYIEDNPANLKLVAQLLARRRHLQLLTAHTPGLGLELAQAHHPELILLDINLPGMDGYQVLELLRADPRLADIPVVAVTANAMPRDIERGMAAGFTDYLTKPLDVARFHRVLDRVLGVAP